MTGITFHEVAPPFIRVNETADLAAGITNNSDVRGILSTRDRDAVRITLAAGIT